MRGTFVATATASLLIASKLVFAADYIDFARTTLLQCAHPTVNLSQAKAEYIKEPSTSGDITTSRIKVFYKGLVKHNSMLVEVYHRRAGKIEQLKVEVLEDTAATGTQSCKYFDGWQDIAADDTRSR